MPGRVNHVVDTDKGFARIVGAIKNAAQQAYVTVGVHQEEGDKPHGAFTVAQIAAWSSWGEASIAYHLLEPNPRVEGV